MSSAPPSERVQAPGRRSNTVEWLVLALIALWVIYNLAFLMKTGFISDDAYNAQIKGKIIQEGTTLNFRILDETEGWLRGSGRIMLLTWYMTYGLYYFVQETAPIKAINILLVVAGVLLFYRFTRKETGSVALAALAALLMPVLFQMRMWHDPLLAFTFLMPISFALVMGALVLFQDYLERGGRSRLVIAATLYLAALLMYEIAYPLCLLFVAVALSRHWKPLRAIRETLPFTLPVVLLVLVSAAFRLVVIAGAYSQSTYPGAELHLQPLQLLWAFGIQLLATVPLSYLFFAKPAYPLVFNLKDWAVAAAWGLVLATALYRAALGPGRPRLAGWVLAGAVLLLVPAALTGLSGHQSELISIGPGFGYIPVYLQYFGLCILAVCGWSLLARRLARHRAALAVLAIVLGAGFAAVSVANLALNRAVALKTNEIYKYPRELLLAALKAGLMEPVPDGATLLRVMRYPSDYTWFYTAVTGRRFLVCDLSDPASYRPCIDRVAAPRDVPVAAPGAGTAGAEKLDLRAGQTWALSYNLGRAGHRDGRVVLARIREVVRNPGANTLVQVVTDHVRVFDYATRTVQEQDFSSAPLNFLKLVQQETVDIDHATPLADASLRASDVAAEWLGKVYPREGSSEANVRWTSGSGTLALHNMSDSPRRIRLTMAFATPTTAPSNLTIASAGKSETLVLGPGLLPYARELTLAPGSLEISLQSDAPPVPNGDPRNIVFGVFNFKLEPVPEAGGKP